MAKKISLREAKESNIRYTGLSEEEQRKRLGYAPAAGDGGEPQEQAGWRPDRQTAADLSESGYDLSVEIRRIPADGIGQQNQSHGNHGFRQ